MAELKLRLPFAVIYSGSGESVSIIRFPLFFVESDVPNAIYSNRALKYPSINLSCSLEHEGRNMHGKV
jgi:hypothetical protein